MADDEDREAEGNRIGLGSKVTPEKINFMTQHARGLICTSIGREIAERLELPQMWQDNTDPFGTAFTVSVDYKTTTTGISAYDRATTIKALADPEASVTLARLAGEVEVAYICEILKEDGHMARRPELEEIAKEYDLPYFTIAELQEYCRSFASSRSEFVNLPTDYGDFEIKDYGNGNLVIKKGKIAKNEPVMLRIHSKCLTGDVFGSKRCDCGHQLHQAMRRIEEKGSGLILYLNQEGRGDWPD